MSDSGAGLDRHGVLRALGIFEGIAPNELDRLVELTSSRRLRRNEVLFRMGDSGRTLYAVLRGRLRAVGEGEDGKDFTFRFLEPGDVIGELGLLDSNPRSLTVEAIEPSELLLLHARDFLPFLERHPRVLVNLAMVLARRLRGVSTLLTDVLFLRLPTRLARRLLVLAQESGKETPDGVRIEVPLRQQQLAEVVGVTRESINKQMREFAEEGLVRQDGPYITVLNRERLEAIANLELP